MGIIQNIHGALLSIGIALLVLFFVFGIVKTCTSMQDVKRPEQALKLFLRFVIARGLIVYGMQFMIAIFDIVQGIISKIIQTAGLGNATQTVIPQEIIDAVENVGFLESIPLWAVTLLGGIFITILSFIMILTVYGRVFKLYMYTAWAPIPLSTFAGEPSQNIGKSFIKSYLAILLEGAVILLACIIFSLFASTPPVVDTSVAAVNCYAIESYVKWWDYNQLTKNVIHDTNNQYTIDF